MDNRTAPLVLIVDDDEMLRVLTRAALENTGFLVSEATDGAELVDAFNTARPDIVLLDVLMPRMDGFDACALLRQEPAAEHVPVLMMTGLDDVDSINRAYEAGATDFVTKPINFDLLGHRLRYMLRAKLTADALRESEARLALAQRIARIGYWECDGAGNFGRWNDETHAVLGLPMNCEVATMAGLGQLLEPADRPRLAEAFAEAVRRCESFTIEFRMRGDHVVHCVALAEAGSDGRPRFIGTMQDISERRRAEQQIHKLSFFDSVTGLPNRAAMRARINQALGPVRGITLFENGGSGYLRIKEGEK